MTNTPTPEMVKAVARAICIDFGGDPDVGTVNARDDVTYQWQIFEGTARAAIKAMRQPTDTMLDAAAPAHAGERIMHKVAYRCMINAALSETPEAGDVS